MTRVVYLNGEFVPDSEAKISDTGEELDPNQTRPWVFANGSQSLSLCQSYSLQLATFSAVS